MTGVVAVGWAELLPDLPELGHAVDAQARPPTALHGRRTPACLWGSVLGGKIETRNQHPLIAAGPPPNEATSVSVYSISPACWSCTRARTLHTRRWPAIPRGDICGFPETLEVGQKSKEVGARI